MVALAGKIYGDIWDACCENKFWRLPDPRIRLEGEEVWRRGGSENARKYNVLGGGAVGGPSGAHVGPMRPAYQASRKAFPPPFR